MHYTCTNDRYTSTPDTFTSVEDFQAMCLEAFGERVSMTRQPLNGVWVDETGTTVLIESDENDAPEKPRVCKWDTVETYVSTYPTNDGDGACDVEVQIGQDEDCRDLGRDDGWFIRTRDDAGGSDEHDDKCYASKHEACAAAKEFANEMHEGAPGESADEYVERQDREQASSDEDEDGDWACVYVSAIANDRVESRHATEAGAAAAVRVAEADMERSHPGSRLAGFVMRRRVGGQWERVDNE